MRRPLLALLVIAALAAGCGDDKVASESTTTTEEAPQPPDDLASTDLEDVEVTGAIGEAPTLEFPKPFGLAETTSRLIEEGDGTAVADGKTVTFDYVFINGRDGTELDSSYAVEPAELPFDDSLNPGIHGGLDGVKAGSRVLIGISPADGLGSAAPEGVLETDTLLVVADIHDVQTTPEPVEPLARAEGEAVEPAAGLPTVELADDGAPTITVPDTDPPAELVVQPLIKGSGPVVASGQSVTVHYTGVNWDTGEVFDSSWASGSPATFSIGTGGVIPGWDQGLVGQTVGSQILLVIPPDLGYGEKGSGDVIPPGATLVFVVDILDAT